MSVARIITFDITSRESFERAQTIVLLNSIDLKEAPAEFSSKIFLIGDSSNSLNMVESRAITYEEACAFCLSNNCSYLEVNSNESFNMKETL